MRPGKLRRGNHRRIVGVSLQPRDILGERPVEKLHLLRQVADQGTADLGRELLERGAVQPDIAPRCGPETGQGMGQG